jgi:hypothetical protein
VQYKKKEGKIDYTGDSNTTNDETSKRRIRREKKSDNITHARDEMQMILPENCDG